MAYTYEYPRPSVTADVVAFSWQNEQLEVLMIQRAQDPFKGEWAFPGGFMDMDETPETCAGRELEEETGLNAEFLFEIGAFGRVDRDPRGRTISVGYWTFFNGEKPNVQADSDAADTSWFNVRELPEMAFDHAEMAERAMNALKDHLLLRQLEGHSSFGLEESAYRKVLEQLAINKI